MTRSAIRQTPGRTCLQGSYHLVWIRIQLQSAKGPSVDRSNITKQMILPKWTEWWTSILTIFTIYVCWPQAKSRGDSLKYQNLYQKNIIFRGTNIQKQHLFLVWTMGYQGIMKNLFGPAVWAIYGEANHGLRHSPPAHPEMTAPLPKTECERTKSATTTDTYIHIYLIGTYNSYNIHIHSITQQWVISSYVLNMVNSEP